MDFNIDEEVEVELVRIDDKNPARKDYILRGPSGEIQLTIAREGSKQQLNMVRINWGEGWRKGWEGSDNLQKLVMRYTGKTFDGYRISFFKKIYKMQLILEPQISHKGELRTLTFKGPTDTTVVTKGRREQSPLRKYLLDTGDLEACSICGSSLPSEFLVVAHIKKRSKSCEEERKDVNIVLPMCVFGCDALFEMGWIGVENGNIVSIRKDKTSRLDTKISPLLGKQVSSWHGPAQVYFQWHANFHRKSSSDLRSIIESES